MSVETTYKGKVEDWERLNERLTANASELAHLEKTRAELQALMEQKELVERLREMGFVATQSSISRDLRDMKIIRINGYYDLPLKPDLSLGVTQVLDEYVQAARIIGPQMILLQVMQGASAIVSRILTDANWPEVAGTLAGLDDKVLVLTSTEAQQKRLFQRLQAFMYDVP